ncbi:MAG TPA: hypothetical protein VIM84_10365 [Gemmatimonadales bacterium]
MRKLSLVVSFLLAVSAVGAALAYLEIRMGEQRIVVQDEWLSSGEPVAYRAYAADTAP